ncbi:acyl carrier protein [Streptomyces sp. NPDC002004]
MTDEDGLLAAVVDAWAEILGIDVEDVPLDKGFFDVGGNSMLLVMLWEELRGLTGHSLQATDLFRHYTVRAQVELLAGDL